MILGLDIGATHCRAVAVGRDSAPQPLPELATPATPDGFADLLRTCLGHAGARPEAVGIGFAATVGEEGRVASWSNRPSYVGFAVDEIARAVFGCPVVWADDCAAAAVAEHSAAAGDAGDAVSSTLYVGIGTGIGAGFVDRGKLLEGATRSAAALGHVPVPSGGDTPCRCGGRGCLQAVAGGAALAALAAPLGLRPDRLASDAAAGDPLARALIDDIVPPLREALDLACRLFDPTRVVIGGGVGGTVPWLAPRLASLLNRPVLPAAHARLGGAIGAAELARRQTGKGAGEGIRDGEPLPPSTSRVGPHA